MFRVSSKRGQVTLHERYLHGVKENTFSYGNKPSVQDLQQERRIVVQKHNASKKQPVFSGGVILSASFANE